MQVRALVFDAYGTLFDVHAVVAAAAALTADPEGLSRLWRQKQLEYTWLRALMGRYEDFWAVTEAALVFAGRALGLSLDDAQRRRLMQAYLTLDAFPDVRPALERLGALPCAILSNGAPGMLEAVVGHNGLGGRFGAVISVDEARTYKPAQAVYALAPRRLGVPAEAIGFVSSNGWDVSGAQAFGFRVVWVNRPGAPAEALGPPPDLEVRDLGGLASALGR